MSELVGRQEGEDFEHVGLTWRVINGEARIQDVSLARALDYVEPTNIRSRINGMREELEFYGSLHLVDAVIIAGKGARMKVTATYLNEDQAYTFIMVSRKPAGARLRQIVWGAFKALKAGDIETAMKLAQPNGPLQNDQAVKNGPSQFVEHVEADVLRRTHNLELRSHQIEAMLIDLHRKVEPSQLVGLVWIDVNSITPGNSPTMCLKENNEWQFR